jgi:predicted acyl esterase
VFTLTPYISQTYHERGMYFAAHGYVLLTVDVRGRGNSEGDFTPHPSALFVPIAAPASVRAR